MYSGISSRIVCTNIFFSGFPLYYADDLMKDMGVDESAKPEYERSIVESCVVGDGV